MHEKLRIKNTDQFRAIVTGGRGELVIQNPITEEQHMLVFGKTPGTDFPIFVRFAEDIGKDSEYVGMLTEEKEFRLTKASRFQWNDKETKTARFAAKIFSENIPVEKCGMNLFQTMRCPVCGRRLKDERSIANGIGPVCAKKLGVAFV